MGRIVVGTDGSRNACAAVAWAAREAKLRGVPLQVIHAWSPGMGAYPSPWYTPTDVGVEASFEASQTIAKRICGTARDQAAEAAPGVEVTCDAIEGSTTQVLVDASADAELLVVGARGHGGFIGLVLGSVSDQCARHAHIPVVVVPAPEEPAAGGEGAPAQ
jgi:nucleotide-binding universal stress UspA family protein